MTDAQFEEILEVLRETRDFAASSARDAAANLVIAYEYKDNLGDPIEKAKFIGRVIKWIVVGTVSAILTISALGEWWAGLVTKWLKH